ncbi:bifunctional diguanylate cyclase/phosphodiesterase [Oceanicella sp. SM1341]|uniref:putative bifunctional diguanylate cyclase/phosphodiesterase n=1 Tax=Oceanicella sp. SM1341 TaxID=1548889 RepID=UPI000E4FD494|nr:bifunctional diguanylate cyclase/phosphodiesterase [Oceanicella sp. SM1341]
MSFGSQPTRNVGPSEFNKRAFLLWRVLPTILIALAVSGAAFLLLEWSAREADRLSLERQRRLFSLAVMDMTENIAHQQESVTVWDDSVLHLQEEPRDQEWLDANMGSWLYSYFGIDASYLLDPDDRAIFASEQGRLLTPEVFAGVAAAVLPRVDRLRAVLRRDDPADVPDRMDSAGVTDLAMVRGHPAIVSAKPVVSDTGDIVQTPGEQYVHVAVRYLDGSFLAEVQERYLFNDLQFDADVANAPGALQLYPLFDGSDATLGYFTWRPVLPGAGVSRRILPALAVLCMLAFAGLGLFLWLLWRRSVALGATEARMHYMALHDALTGLPNRAMFVERVESALTRSAAGRGGTALLYIDLDHFKQVNDTLGHPAGDQLIQEAGRRLQGLTRDTDTVARVGGDEFAIVMTGVTEQAHVERLCDRIGDSARIPFDIEGNQIFMGMSIGYAMAGADGPGLNELVRRADVALYRAKSLGRSRHVVYEKDMDALLQERRRTEADLRIALREGGQLQVCYQPIYAARNGALTGFEALLRWQHPELGPISPEVFIPIAEETGLIEPLGAWVMREACTAAGGWPDLVISVNVSAIELRDPDYAGRLADLLRETGLAPERLELELTESTMIEAPGAHMQNLRSLRGMGVRLVIDDFGTGFSCLGRLQSLEVDRIKIDRSFIHALGRSSSDEAIVRAIIDLAHATILETTAEGVETEEQRARIRALGCDSLQGFLFSEALSHRDADALVAAGTRGAGPEPGATDSRAAREADNLAGPG